jgi:hypothetical protein
LKNFGNNCTIALHVLSLCNYEPFYAAWDLCPGQLLLNGLAPLAGKLHPLARKIGQGFDWLKDFPTERNNRVYFRRRKILQAIKDSARARHTGAIFGQEDALSLKEL